MEPNPHSNEWNDFTIALKEVCFELAMMIVPMMKEQTGL